MHWVSSLDVGLLRLINEKWSNGICDRLMPFVSGNRYFFPAVFIAGLLMLWKGGKRGRLCVLMLALIVWPGDSFICNTIKHAVSRPRPFVTLPDIRQPIKMANHRAAPAPATRKAAVAFNPSRPLPNHNSMPSSHAANWFAATMILFLYYRKSWRIMLPLACLVSFSRLYNGVHYPTDVLAGAILGAGYAVAGLWAFNAIWQLAGPKWFPIWWRATPSLSDPQATAGAGTADQRPATLEQHWLRLGYVFIALMLLFRLWYIGSGTIELTGDEAYQWVWSKHPALSYYSKPPLIAYTQWLGTHLWGDTEFGVRFFSPILAALGSLLLLKFLARTVNARAAFVFLLVATTTPLISLGSILMTIDPLSVFFWIAAMLAGWRAIQTDSKISDWLWTGLWLGFGFLSKYTELLQLLCWAIFFALWKPARAHLRRPGPWLALLVNLLCAVPVIVWNAQHGWITVTHVAGNAGLRHGWSPHVFQFVAVEALLLNVVWFIAAAWAAIAFWRAQPRDPLPRYLFSMGAPLFLCYLFWSFHSGIEPNWIAPSVLPLLCLATVYWNARWQNVKRWARPCLLLGVIGGGLFVALLHNTNVVQRLAGKPLPPKPDPLTRARGYAEMARIANHARLKLAAQGKPAFLIASHYGITGELTFYLPEAKTNVVTRPLVYAISTDRPANQFYFWPGYEQTRKGQNAIFIRELGMPALVHGWIFKWLSGVTETNLYRYQPQPGPAPPILLRQFTSVRDLGLYYVRYRGRIFHIIELFECRDLR